MDFLSALPLYDWTQTLGAGTVARWAIGLIYFQGLAIAGLFLFVLAVCISRNFRSHYRSWRSRIYNGRLIVFLLCERL